MSFCHSHSILQQYPWHKAGRLACNIHVSLQVRESCIPVKVLNFGEKFRILLR